MPPKVRCTNRQKRILIEYMATHTLFANGEFSGPLGARRYEEQWAELAAMLQEYGPEKPVQAWKNTWRDLKRKARGDNAAANSANMATGNVYDVPVVGEEEEMILSVIGKASSVGIGPPESGIGGDDVYLPPVEYGASPTFTHSQSLTSPPSSPTAPLAASSLLSALLPTAPPRFCSSLGGQPRTAPRFPLIGPPRAAPRFLLSATPRAAGRFCSGSPPPLAAPRSCSSVGSSSHAAPRCPVDVPGPFRAAPTCTATRAAPRTVAAPGPSGSVHPRTLPARPPRSRPARSEPATFAALQKENNNLLELIHRQLLKSNELRREQVEVLREQNRILATNRTTAEDSTVVLDEEFLEFRE